MVEREPMTLDGIRKMRERLKQLKEVEMPQTSREIEVARAHGDLKENAEYHAAREKQGMMMATIRDLEDKVSRAQVIDTSTLSGDRVVFGAIVSLLDLDNDDEITYQILGEDEADLKAGKLSVKAPLARALIGKSLDDEVVVRTPGGIRRYEITDVQYK